MAGENTQISDKEKEAQLKALRQELEREIEDRLPQEFLEEKKISDETLETRELATDEEAKRVIEAILFTASKPINVAELKRVIKGFGAAKLDGLVRELQSEYQTQNRSFRIQEIAGGFECSTDPKYAPWIMKLELQRKARQATQSALETLAILAYKQPITRAEIEDLRGVDVSGVLSTLLDRNLIKIAGRKEIAGRPFLYSTTEKFLEHFGLKSLQDLPNISEIKALVENSVKREDLLRTEKIISNDETPSAEPTSAQPADSNSNPSDSTEPESSALDSTANIEQVNVENQTPSQNESVMP